MLKGSFVWTADGTCQHTHSTDGTCQHKHTTDGTCWHTHTTDSTCRHTLLMAPVDIHTLRMEPVNIHTLLTAPVDIHTLLTAPVDKHTSDGTCQHTHYWRHLLTYTTDGTCRHTHTTDGTCQYTHYWWHLLTYTHYWRHLSTHTIYTQEKQTVVLPTQARKHTDLHFLYTTKTSHFQRQAFCVSIARTGKWSLQTETWIHFLVSGQLVSSLQVPFNSRRVSNWILTFVSCTQSPQDDQALWLANLHFKTLLTYKPFSQVKSTSSLKGTTIISTSST